MDNILLNDSESFDGIVDKILIENNLKKITLHIKQWDNSKTHCLSILEFNNVIFQSLPDISSFNLITEVIRTKDVEGKLKEYIEDNPTLILSNTEDNILEEIRSLNDTKLFLLESGYCANWLIICTNFELKETKNLKNSST